MSIWVDTNKVLEAIASSKTRAEVIQKLNRSVTTATYRRLKMFERQFNVDVSHFRPWSTQKRKDAAPTRRTDESIFCEHSTASQSVLKSHILRDKLISYKCNSCPIVDQWNGQTINLQLEHKNGIHNDHRIENLCFLCPNCHSQTKTFCGRNVTGKRVKRNFRAELLIKHQPEVDKVLNSGIDFTRLGWSTQVAKLLNKNPQKVKDWMMRYMPDFYKSCFHRKGHIATIELR
jgi:5-methylcytosine-specific restriction endonuclease McrA